MQDLNKTGQKEKRSTDPGIRASRELLHEHNSISFTVLAELIKPAESC